VSVRSIGPRSREASPSVRSASCLREVARALGVSTPIVYRLCDRGELAYVRVSNAIRISPQGVIDYLRARDL